MVRHGMSYPRDSYKGVALEWLDDPDDWIAVENRDGGFVAMFPTLQLARQLSGKG